MDLYNYIFITSDFRLEKYANRLSKLTRKELTAKFGRALGQGSSRVVYQSSGKYSIKVAKNDFGLQQNEREEEVYRLSPQFVRRKLNSTLAISDDNRILISRYANQLRRWTNELKNKAGIKKRTFEDSLGRSWINEEILVGPVWEFLGNWNYPAMGYIKGGGVGFIGDFLRPSSWGIQNGKLVLIDYGY